ncbi:TPA: hypothetical protein JLV17_002114, partial [Escherichia coli]|nr:hypothetical protein [Escherichia coli]
MTTYNTRNPLGSAAAKDLYDNAQNFDHLSNDKENEVWKDRFGVDRLTWYGMEKRYQEKLSSMGWNLMDSFQEGNTLTEADQALRWKLPDGDGEYYRWDGEFPKFVTAGSTPDSSGGIGTGAWIGIGDAALRSNLASEEGAGMVGTSSGKTVQEEISSINDEIASLEPIKDSVIDLQDQIDVLNYGGGASLCTRHVYSDSNLNIHYHITRIPKGVGNIAKEYPHDPVFSDGVMYVEPEDPTTTIRRKKHYSA